MLANTGEIAWCIYSWITRISQDPYKLRSGTLNTDERY